MSAASIFLFGCAIWFALSITFALGWSIGRLWPEDFE